MIEKGNGYKAHEFEEIAKDNNLQVEVAMDNTMKEDGKCIETSSPLFQETWAMVDGNISFNGDRAITEDTQTKLRPKRREVEGRKQRSKLMHMMKSSNKA